MDHSQWHRSWWVLRSKARMGCTLAIAAGHEIESEVGLCADHSGGLWDQKRGCLFHNKLGSLLWTVVFRLTRSWLPAHFCFHQAQEICERVSCSLQCHAWNLKNELVWSSAGKHMCFRRYSWLLSRFIHCNVVIHPNHASNLLCCKHHLVNIHKEQSMLHACAYM